MEDGKERDPNQSSCKMDGAERYGEEEGKGGEVFNRGGSVERDGGRGGECARERWIWIYERW